MSGYEESAPKQSLFESLMTKFNQDSIVINPSKYVVKNFTIDDCLYSLSNYGRINNFAAAIDKENAEMIEKLIEKGKEQVQKAQVEVPRGNEDTDDAVATYQDPNEVIGDLYEGYFSSKFDPAYSQIVHVLNWSLNDQRDYERRDARFMKAIEKADVDKDMVDLKVQQMIQKNKRAIASSEEANVDIRNDLRRALERIHRARLTNANASKIFQMSYLKITRLQRRKDNLRTVENLLQNFQLLSDVRKSAEVMFERGEALTACQCYLSLLKELTSSSIYTEFEIARELTRKVIEALPAISRKSEKTLEIICSRRFNPSSPTQYERLMQSFLKLEAIRVIVTSNNLYSAPSSPSPLSSSTSTSSQKHLLPILSVENLPEVIFNNVCNDISYCARNAVLEGIYTVNATKDDYEDVRHIHLPELPLDLLIRHITQGCYVDCVIRCAELLTTSIDTYNEIAKWHQTYIEDDNHEGKDEVFNIGVKLQSKKGLIWDKAEKCVCMILNALTPTPSTPSNDFQILERVVGKFNLLGSVFCGRASEVSSLYISMKEVSFNYYMERERWNMEKKRLDKDIQAKRQEKAVMRSK